jgi:hypothetical protein
LFTNVNAALPRLWRAGEPFEQAAKNFLPRLRPPFPGSLWMLERLHITKGKRSLYDHFMLGIHDAMKADERYQAQVEQAEIAFPAGATWACFTDAVSHAAMSGQHAFEQTFYLPVSAMRGPPRWLQCACLRELGERWCPEAPLPDWPGLTCMSRRKAGKMRRLAGHGPPLPETLRVI